MGPVSTACRWTFLLLACTCGSLGAQSATVPATAVPSMPAPTPTEPSMSAPSLSANETIRALRSASNAALAAGDVDAFMASIDADYVGTAGNGGHIRSRDALRTLIEGIAASPTGLRFVRTPDGIEVDDDDGRALEAGGWVGREAVGGSERTTARGRYAAYWRRLDGAWVIHAELFVTLPGGGADGYGDPGR